VGFVSNDLRGSVTIFGNLLFMVFPTVKPINKVCCNTVKSNQKLINESIIVEVVGHIDVS
jgi:hypothetical protein